MSTGSHDDRNEYSADWIDDPANDDALRRLLWDILTLPEEMYDSIDPTGCAEPYDALSFPPGCSFDGVDAATKHPHIWRFQTATPTDGRSLRCFAIRQRWDGDAPESTRLLGCLH